MEPVTAVLFVMGVIWACREGGRSAARATGARRQAARAAATARGGTRNQAGSRRRAARQATLGYWAGELRHGFPEIQHGLARGWREHQLALAQHQASTAAHQASTRSEIARLRAEAAAHQRRLAAIHVHDDPPPQGRDKTGGPHMGAPAAGCTNKDCSCHQAADPPLADGTTPGSGPAANGTRPQAAPATNGGQVSEMNYEAAVETAGKLIAAADEAVNDDLLAQATGMADGLAGMVPSDSTTQGQAADVVTAATDVIEAHKRLADGAAAMKNRLETTYGPTHEDVQASGERAAEPAFHDA